MRTEWRTENRGTEETERNREQSTENREQRTENREQITKTVLNKAINAWNGVRDRQITKKRCYKAINAARDRS
jgi:hypothetical protein